MQQVYIDEKSTLFLVMAGTKPLAESMARIAPTALFTSWWNWSSVQYWGIWKLAALESCMNFMIGRQYLITKLFDDVNMLSDHA